MSAVPQAAGPRSGDAAPSASLESNLENGRLTLRPRGAWTVRAEMAAPLPALGVPAGDEISQVAFDCSELEAWDSRLVVFVRDLVERCRETPVAVDLSALPDGVGRLLDLAEAAPERADDASAHPARKFLAEVGGQAIAFTRSAGELIEFTGAAAMALGRMVRGKARFRHRDMFRIMQEVGAEALPIVSLISVLVGLILAYIGSLQLSQFGADEYVANLVAIAMAREMAAMMTGIIMAGRTGAAFAAQLGTMTANEEIDALRTAAIPPMEFLVLPRIIALVFMLPLLTIYANLMGMFGGALVGLLLLDIDLLQYVTQTRAAVTLTDFGTGLFKAAVYGVIVAVSGCLRGMQCGRSAAAVGEATTSAVVTGIVFIVVCSATLTVVYQVLGI